MSSVVVEMTGDEAKLYRSLQRVIDQQAKLDEKMKESKNNSKASEDAATKAAAEQEKALGGLIKNLSVAAIGFTALNTLQQKAIELLQSYRTEQDKAAKESIVSERPLAALAQLASDDESFAKLTGIAKEMYAKGVTDKLEKAAAVTFDLESAGLLGERDILEQLGSRGVVDDVGGMSRAAKTLITTMGRAETGSLEDILDKGFAASGFSPATVPQLLEAAALSGGTARELKISDEDLLAASAVTATAMGGADKGGQRLSAFLRVLDKQGGFAGAGIEGAVTKIGKMGLEGSELQTWFGSSEALEAYRALRDNLPDLARNREAIIKADQEGMARQRAAIPGSDAELSAAREARQAAAREELSRRPMGAITNETDAAVSSAISVMREDNQAAGRSSWAGEMEIAMLRAVSSTARFFFGDELVKDDIQIVPENGAAKAESPVVDAIKENTTATKNAGRQAAQASAAKQLGTHAER